MSATPNSSQPAWAAAIAQFTADPTATDCAALPSPVQLSRWTVAKTLGLLAERTNEPSLLIGGKPALEELAALPPATSVGSFLQEVELGTAEQFVATESGRYARGVVRLPLADAIDFVLRECFSDLHGLRLQRLRVSDQVLRQMGGRATAVAPAGNKDDPARFP